MQCLLKLENNYKKPQKVEFTVEDGVLYVLKTSEGLCTPHARTKIAIDMVEERLLTVYFKCN